MRGDYTFTIRTIRNVVGGGYFRETVLYRNGKQVSRYAYDGFFGTRRAERKALAKVREWRDLYDAHPS